MTIVIIAPFFPSLSALSYYYPHLFIEILGPRYFAFVFASKILS